MWIFVNFSVPKNPENHNDTSEKDCLNPEVLARDQKDEEELRVCYNIDVEDDDVFYANRTQKLPLTRSDGICSGSVREALKKLQILRTLS